MTGHKSPDRISHSLSLASKTLYSTTCLGHRLLRHLSLLLFTLFSPHPRVLRSRGDGGSRACCCCFCYVPILCPSSGERKRGTLSRASSSVARSEREIERGRKGRREGGGRQGSRKGGRRRGGEGGCVGLLAIRGCLSRVVGSRVAVQRQVTDCFGGKEADVDVLVLL